MEQHVDYSIVTRVYIIQEFQDAMFRGLFYSEIFPLNVKYFQNPLVCNFEINITNLNELKSKTNSKIQLLNFTFRTCHISKESTKHLKYN